MTQELSLKDELTEFLLYTTPNGNIKVEVFLHDENLWMNQKKMAELFDVEIPTIKALIEKKSEMNLIISKSFLDLTYKTQMNYWINSYTNMLKNYVELKEN